MRRHSHRGAEDKKRSASVSEGRAPGVPSTAARRGARGRNFLPRYQSAGSRHSPGDGRHICLRFAVACAPRRRTVLQVFRQDV